jgi:hypothetical protein
MRSPTALVIAMMLPDQPVRNWAVTVAVDVDRDGWTQLQMQFDTTGQKSAWLNCRFTPRLRLAGKTFLLQSPREAVNGQRTIELALPVDRLGGAVSGGLWRLQIRATPSDIGPDGALWLEAGPDATLQTSVSYPLVKVPPTPINAGP